MNKYLLEILKESNTIIIPGLGALTVTNKEKGEIMFMSYLKHDDGKLSSYIAEKDGVDETEAKNTIAKYVREIQSTLDKGDSFDMFQFGKFTKDNHGEIEFHPWEGSEESTEEPKKPEAPKVETPPVVEAPVKEEKPTKVPKKEEKVEEKDETPKVVETPKVEEKKEEKPPVAETPKKETTPEKKITPVEPPKKEKKPTVEEPKKIVPPVVPISQATPPKEEKKPEKELNIAQKEELAASVDRMNDLKKKQEDTPKEKKKRGAGFWVLMVLLLLLVAGGTYVAIDYDNVKQHIPFLADNDEPADEDSAIDKMRDLMGENEQASEEEDAIEESDESELDETSEEGDDNEEVTEEEVSDNSTEEEQPEIEETPVQETISTPVSSGSGQGPYHVVAGAFSNEANAARMVEKLQAQGLPSYVIMNNGMHVVSMKSFASSAEANAELSALRQTSSGAWILYKP